jgi:hypothetical protein
MTPYIRTMLLGVTLVAALALSAQNDCRHQLQLTPFTADGDAIDSPEFYCEDRKSGVYYAVSYNDKYLYISLDVAGLVLQNQIVLTGLTTWIETDEGKKGVLYPMGLPASGRPKDTYTLDYYIGAIRQNLPERLAGADRLALINFYGKHDTVIGSTRNPGGINAGIQLDTVNLMHLELALPRSAFPGMCSGPLTLRFETGGLGRPTDLRGSDAVGQNPGVLQDMTLLTRASRERQVRIDRYLDYASPTEWKLTGIRCGAEP